MPYKQIAHFSFSIPNQPDGVAKQDLSRLLQKMNKAKVKLRGMAGFAAGRRIEVFCVPVNAVALRAFLKSARIRAEEGSGFLIDGEPSVGRVTAVIDFIALSGFNIGAFGTLAVAGKAAGLVWSK